MTSECEALEDDNPVKIITATSDVRMQIHVVW